MATIISESVFPSSVFAIVNGTASVSESAPIDGLSNIIRSSETWEAKFDWETTGTLNDTITGKWTVDLYLERMGPLEAPVLPGTTTIPPIDLVPVAGANSVYTVTMPFAAGLVPDGLYQVTAAITMKGPLGNPKPISGFVDMGLVQFYAEP